MSLKFMKASSKETPSLVDDNDGNQASGEATTTLPPLAQKVGKKRKLTSIAWAHFERLTVDVGAKDHQRFQASYATILKAHMTNLKKRERKDKKKAAGADKKEGELKKPKRV